MIRPSYPLWWRRPTRPGITAHAGRLNIAPSADVRGTSVGALRGTIQLQLRNTNQSTHMGAELDRMDATMNRAEVISQGVTEGDALDEILGADNRTDDRQADLIAAIHQLEELMARAPLLLRVLYHAMYAELKPDNSDVWARVGAATGCTKNQAWRKAHPPGMETEPTV